MRLKHPYCVRYLSFPHPQMSISLSIEGILCIQHIRTKYRDISYWAMPDLLGLFLSSLGRAPSGANKHNFYLPLTALIGRWCSRFLKSSRNSPRVYQCTWNNKGEFALGASTWDFAVDRPLGGWKALLDKARFAMIRSSLLALANLSQSWTP